MEGLRNYDDQIKHEERFLGIANASIALIMVASVIAGNPSLHVAIIVSLIIWLVVGGQLQRFVLILRQRKEKLETSKINK